MSEAPIKKANRQVAKARGFCSVCCIREATLGFVTCDQCRQYTQDRRRFARESSFGNATTGKAPVAPVVPVDRFCVACQAHGFHRADCPTLKPKRPKPLAIAAELACGAEASA